MPQVPLRRPPDQIAVNPRAHAQRIRALMGWAPICGQPDDVYTSPFRRSARLRPIHECELQQLAARQVAEVRGRLSRSEITA